MARTRLEYARQSPTPKAYDHVLAGINNMWATQPNFTLEQLNSIKVPTWIVDADHDEAIKRTDTEFMAQSIPNAGLLIEPDVSHFAFLQDPWQFNTDVLHFLEHVQGN
jgi:pimeloyl-ACP methyl ester carboxylesterase